MIRLLMRIVFGPSYQGPIDMVLFWRYAKARNGMINGFKPVRYFRFGTVVIKQLGWRLSIRDRNDVVRPYWADKDDRWSRISQEYK